MHRVPPLPGAELAYAGAVGGAVIAIDLTPRSPQPSGTSGARWVDCSVTVVLAVQGEPVRSALRGLGFARVERLMPGAARHRRANRPLGP